MLELALYLAENRQKGKTSQKRWESDADLDLFSKNQLSDPDLS